MERYDFIRREAANYSVRVICKVFNVSKSSYYEYIKGKTHRALTETGVSDELRRVFQEHRRRYGSRRLRAEMQANGYKIGRHGIRKLLKVQGLKAIQPRRRFAAAICSKDYSK